MCAIWLVYLERLIVHNFHWRGGGALFVGIENDVRV